MSEQLEAAIRQLVDALREELVVTAAPDAPERLLTVDDARAALGGIARSTIYVEIAEGRLRSLSVGRRRLIPSGAIAAYIANRETVR